jgi:PelA/Pel-15E family pectate lyase
MRTVRVVALLALFSGATDAAMQHAIRNPVEESDGLRAALTVRAPAWYAGDEARAVAANVISWQSAEGGWPKNIDLSEPATVASLSRAVDDGRTNSLDNGATILPMRFLAKVAGTNPAVERAFMKGLDYLFDAQYPNGGWPQFYPLREGYFSRITFNDNAMTNVLFLLRDIVNEEPDFDFVGPDRRGRAAEALQRGIDLILATQIRQDGRLTAWCAQYDQVTLAPAWARTYEPPSLSGMETVAIVRFLMAIERPSQQQIAAVEAAVAWLESVAIYGLQYRRIVDDQGKEDGIVVADPGAGPLWARFYDLHTNRPIFTGRDSVIHYSLHEIEQERRGGYGYYGAWGSRLLEEDYPRWRERHSG